MIRNVLRLSGLVPRLPASSGTVRTHTTPNYTWHLLPAADKLFADGPDLAKWRAEGRVETIKTGSQRNVYRVRLPHATIIVKTSHVNGLRAWWREVFRGSKSQLEFEHARELRLLGLPAIEPLAWGEQSRYFPSENTFITRDHATAVPLTVYLERLGSNKQHIITSALGSLLAYMHDAGVVHPDPHPGNFLLTWEDEQPRFSLIDFHGIRFGQPLGWKASLDNLVLLNRWFQLRASRTDRLAFWNSYVKHRSTLPTECPVTLEAMAKEVELRTAQSNARFWNNRLDRYRKSNRQYRRVRRGSVAGHAVRELPEAFIERLLADPDAPFRNPDAKILKDSRSSTVIELHIPTPTGVTVGIFKRFRLKSKLLLAKNLLRDSSALRSWSFGHNLLDRGLPTARPLLVLHRYQLGCPAEGYLLTERVPDAVELSDAVKQISPEVRRRVFGMWAYSLARLVRTMHERQIAHRDLKAPNILMSQFHADPANAVPVLIDLVGLDVGSSVSRANRIRNLARLNASFWNSTVVSRSDRLRFLRTYLWGQEKTEDWKEWWRAIARATLAKVEQNRRNDRPLA